MASVFRPGATALITGGASGIGFATAQLCRSHGMHLALVDINAGNMAKASELLLKTNPQKEEGGGGETKTETYIMDVSKLSEWKNLRNDVEAKFGGVDLLMLNAGAAPQPQQGKQSWEDVEYFEKTFATNLMGPINGLAAFLPLMQQQQNTQKHTSSKSSIILTGSKQGITNPPGNPAYNSSKSALKTLAEHLSHDLRTTHPSITVHLLIPGWTYTSLSGNSGPTPDSEALKTKKPGAWLPSQVVEYAYKKIAEEGKFYIVCPDNDVSDELDQARMTWGAGDWIEGRSALSRWDPGWKDRAAEWIAGEAERRKRD